MPFNLFEFFVRNIINIYIAVVIFQINNMEGTFLNFVIRMHPPHRTRDFNTLRRSPGAGSGQATDIIDCPKNEESLAGMNMENIQNM